MQNQTGPFQAILDRTLTFYDEKLDLELNKLFQQTKTTIAVAESMTCGRVSERLTTHPGSSSYFVAGIICYSIKAKIKYAKVSPSSVKKYTVMSSQVAQEMAIGIREENDTDFGLSTTGIAGPENKEYDASLTGIIHIGFSSRDITRTQEFKFEGTRQEITAQSAQATLGLLKTWLPDALRAQSIRKD